MQKTTRDSVTAVRAELLRHPGIESVASASYLPTETIGWGGLTWEGGEARQEFQAAFLSVDADFVKTLGLTVVEGRNFSAANPADAGRFLVNQAAVRQMGVNHALGLQIQFWHHRGPIVGVVRDFANRHLANATAPMVMSCGPWGVNRNYLFLKLKPGDPRPALRHFQAVWRRVNPGFPAEYQFLDEAYDRMYANERRLSRIILGFTLLAVFISGLGLVGLASFLAEEKTKEIGVRKVVGASSWRIVSLLSMNFARLVLAANVIAWPLGYLVMHQWLENYADHVRIGPLVFILAGAAGLVAALFSVGYQTLRAATANPVESLRHE
jgi:putative ABC transport system permease protein